MSVKKKTGKKPALAKKVRSNWGRSSPRNIFLTTTLTTYRNQPLAPGFSHIPGRGPGSSPLSMHAWSPSAVVKALPPRFGTSLLIWAVPRTAVSPCSALLCCSLSWAKSFAKTSKKKGKK